MAFAHGMEDMPCAFHFYSSIVISPGNYEQAFITQWLKLKQGVSIHILESRSYFFTKSSSM